jgi:hypothetical protein
MMKWNVGELRKHLSFICTTASNASTCLHHYSPDHTSPEAELFLNSLRFTHDPLNFETRNVINNPFIAQQYVNDQLLKQ